MEVIQLSTVQREEISWLWYGRIPYGKLTMLDGDPGLGKSTLTADWAARVSRGVAMPGEKEKGLPDPAGVLLICAEDGLADTIVPRLEAANADLTRIIAIEDLIKIPQDLKAVEAIIVEHKVRLLIIDPLMAYLHGDAYKDQEVRQAMSPLATMAQRRNCAVIIVRHLNKQADKSALYRGGGSIGIIGAVRCGLIVTEQENSKSRLLSVFKSNLAPIQPAYKWKLKQTEGGMAKIQWFGPIELSADEALGGKAADKIKYQEALAFLRGHLPLKQSVIEERGREMDISMTTLQRAKTTLGAKSRKVGFGSDGVWEWYIPSPVDDGTPAQG